MTEFGSLKEIHNELNDARSALVKLRNDKAGAKRKHANSTDLQNKKNTLLGLQHLMDTNNKSFSDVSTDEEKQKLVERARELFHEIERVKEEIASFDNELKDFDKQEILLVKELHRLEKQQSIYFLETNLNKSLSEASSIDGALGSVEAALNQAFNYRGVFEGEDFVNNTFAQESIKRVLSERFNEKQVEALMSVAARRAVSFISAYADNDDDFDMTVGAYFSTLRAQIEIVEDFAN